MLKSVQVAAAHRARFQGTFSDRLAVATERAEGGRKVHFVDLWAFGWRVLWVVR